MRARGRHSGQAGLTILELVIVLAIISMMLYLAVGAVRWIRGANGVDASVELAGVMRRTSQLATASGTLYRVVIDLDNQTYRVEECAGGPAAISKTPERAPAAVEANDDTRRKAVEDAKQKLSSLPKGVLPAGSGAGGAEGEADEMALALANQLAARRVCTAPSVQFGDANGLPPVRQLDPNRSARIKQVWVNHLQEPVSSGLVAIHFFPLGSVEKSIIEIGDGEKTFSVLAHGLTGRIEVQDSAVKDPEAFLFRDAEGEEEKAR